MKYLKYERMLYEISNEQAEKMFVQIERGGRIMIDGNLLFAGKCEIIKDMPYNREEYTIVPMARKQLEAPAQGIYRQRTPQEQERVRILLAEGRAYLSKKLGWEK